jgi:hypothetical protein
MDETSTNLHEDLNRVWQPKGKMLIKKSRSRGSGVTILGALSHGKLFTTLANGTNKDTVAEFFLKMSEKHDLTGSVIVLDNHRAHLSKKSDGAIRGLELPALLFASSQQPIEPN